MAKDPKVVVNAPAGVVEKDKVNLGSWIGLLNDLRKIDLSKDTSAVRNWISQLKTDPSAQKPARTIPEEEVQKLTDKATAQAELAVKEHKSDLLTMNAEGRFLVNRFHQDGKTIEAIDKLLSGAVSAIKSGGGNETQRAYAKQLGEAVSLLKETSKLHSDLMHVPLLSHQAVTRCVKALKGSS